MTDEIAAPWAAALADRYRIGRPLGQGGMAIVYAADDLEHGRQVAIEIPPAAVLLRQLATGAPSVLRTHSVRPSG